MPFRLFADDQADLLKFKRWFRIELRKAATMTKSFDEEALEKYGKDIDVCLGDYNEKGVPNSEMAVYNLSWADFMSKQELKEYKTE